RGRGRRQAGPARRRDGARPERVADVLPGVARRAATPPHLAHAARVLDRGAAARRAARTARPGPHPSYGRDDLRAHRRLAVARLLPAATRRALRSAAVDHADRHYARRAAGASFSRGAVAWRDHLELSTRPALSRPRRRPWQRVRAHAARLADRRGDVRRWRMARLSLHGAPPARARGSP